MKRAIMLLKKTEYLSALSVRLTQLTGKSKIPIHPKHLLKSKIWFSDHLGFEDIVLDLGSNAGQTSLKIAGKVKKVIGIEINHKLVDQAKQQAKAQKISNVEFLTGDANKKLPFKNNYFDKVICSDVLEHLQRRDFALSEIRRTLKPKGVLFLVTDNPDTSWKKKQKSEGLFYYADPEHRYEYPKDEIIKMLKSKKFSIQSVELVTYDTPLKGMIDVVGGFSLSLYKKLGKWRQNMVKRYPEESTGFKIIAVKL